MRQPFDIAAPIVHAQYLHFNCGSGAETMDMNDHGINTTIGIGDSLANMSFDLARLYCSA